jgi:hypothetical protein
MLLDWVTARIEAAHMSRECFLLLRSLGDRIRRFNPRTGAVTWESAAWDSIRSDTHGVTFRVGSDALWIQGSPARIEGNGCNVFGGEISQSLDIEWCANAMTDFLQPQLLRLCFQHFRPGLSRAFSMLPAGAAFVRFARMGLPRHFRVTRVDVTQNYKLESLAAVRVALQMLRGLEGGRYRVSQQAGDTVYFSHTSKMASGKVYAKGPHLQYLNKRKGGQYTAEEIAAAGPLLRFELKLGCEFFRHNETVNPDLLRARFDSFFTRMLGADTVTTDDSILTALLALPGVKPGAAKAAFASWSLLQSHGWQWVREYLPRNTYYRHRKLLLDAGIGDIDLSAGKVVSLRRSPLIMTPVNNWHDIAA